MRLTRDQAWALQLLRVDGYYLVWSAKPFITDGVMAPVAPHLPKVLDYRVYHIVHANTAMSFARHMWIEKRDPKINKYTISNEGRVVLGRHELRKQGRL